MGCLAPVEHSFLGCLTQFFFWSCLVSNTICSHAKYNKRCCFYLFWFFALHNQTLNLLIQVPTGGSLFYLYMCWNVVSTLDASGSWWMWARRVAHVERKITILCLNREPSTVYHTWTCQISCRSSFMLVAISSSSSSSSTSYYSARKWTCEASISMVERESVGLGIWPRLP